MSGFGKHTVLGLETEVEEEEEIEVEEEEEIEVEEEEEIEVGEEDIKSTGPCVGGYIFRHTEQALIQLSQNTPSHTLVIDTKEIIVPDIVISTKSETLKNILAHEPNKTTENEKKITLDVAPEIKDIIHNYFLSIHFKIYKNQLVGLYEFVSFYHCIDLLRCTELILDRIIVTDFDFFLLNMDHLLICEFVAKNFTKLSEWCIKITPNITKDKLLTDMIQKNNKYILHSDRKMLMQIPLSSIIHFCKHYNEINNNTFISNDLLLFVLLYLHLKEIQLNNNNICDEFDELKDIIIWSGEKYDIGIVNIIVWILQKSKIGITFANYLGQKLAAVVILDNNWNISL